MDVVSIHKVATEPLEMDIFTGKDVTIQEILPDSEEFTINIVNFGKGIRNKLHTHTTEQILIVTAGTGIVATETQQRLVTVGDIVRIPAGQKHWHGATEKSEFSHVYVMARDSELVQVED
ncbi:hypothetical protein D3OALGA1CA_3918 [Olavius algarvensis associated proteobacterium Delta 3]|nr:hypothetical protein D3OALGB2SA_2133 [Olavius algarvensis associated proteobacterium Delta 3]CAB5142210.1 hypothetical protein D3OALGA1CA_3918 [Olavius algarvensis associated proteobacterium Delta 3]